MNSLAKWKVNYSITSVAFSSLLKILNEHNCFNSFPLYSRTVMKTNKSNMTNQIQTVNSGLYYHFGISNGLMSVYDLSVFEKLLDWLWLLTAYHLQRVLLVLSGQF